VGDFQPTTFHFNPLLGDSLRSTFDRSPGIFAVRNPLFLCEQFPRPAFAGECPRILTHEPDIAEMDQAGIESDVHHDLQEGLVGKISTDAGVEVPHEPGGVHVVPDEPVTSSMALGRSIHKEMNFVQRQHSQEIPGR